MDEKQSMEQMIEDKEQHYSEKDFFKTLKKYGAKLGFKGLHTAATLYTALKSPNMSKGNKMIILGALGYFILPLDMVADILPVVGLSDDLVVLTTALAKVFMSMDDDMKNDAHALLKKTFGERYVYEEVDTVDMQ
ncbi:YkvA family protein [Lysinibacillus sp. LZ02]|uniref:YkvA family protein n=1 Tax=Lysinibacillus sp. LZ02 TaxID=3420668 RepID=UPI003D36815E